MLDEVSATTVARDERQSAPPPAGAAAWAAYVVAGALAGGAFAASAEAPLLRAVLVGLAVCIASKATQVRAGFDVEPASVATWPRLFVTLIVPPAGHWTNPANRGAGLARTGRGALKLVAFGALASVLARTAGHPLAAALAPAVEAVSFFLALSGIGDVVVGAIGVASGAAFDEVFDSPLAARSLRDFWGRRWNRFVSRFLHRFVFLPVLHKRGAAAGVLAAFAASALFHEAVALASLGVAAWRPGLMTVFFLAHGLATLAERPLAARAPALARPLALAFLLATAPIFIAAIRPLYDAFAALLKS